MVTLRPPSSSPSTPPYRIKYTSKWKQNRNSDTSEANLDPKKMVIMLAALLCALICALGLNAVVRRALRCIRRFAFQTHDEAASRSAAIGLKKSALRQIPVVIYGASGIHMITTDCAICLGEYLDGEKVRVLPKCNHGFHVGCIDTWLESHSSCPICRRSLLEQPGASSDGAGGLRIHGNGGAVQSDVVAMAEGRDRLM